MLRILHVFFAKSQISAGILNQLSYESSAAEDLIGCQWDLIYWLPGSYPDNQYIKGFNNNLLFIFINNIKFYFWLNKVSIDYDYIILRYPSYDPFAFLLNLKCKHLTIHHTNESLEAKHNRFHSLKKIIEKYITRKLIQTACGCIGVTQEIASTAQRKSNKDIPVYTLPNGINFNKIRLLQKEPKATQTTINLLFVASSNSVWHGLDRIIESINNDIRFELFIVGNINLNNFKKRNGIHILGYKNKQQINKIASRCDIALGGFGFDRINLSEATTLKVREYLAMGLPVYSGVKDSALPDDFFFYKYTLHNFDSDFLYQFYLDVKTIDSEQIRNESEQYISKKSVMSSFITSLTGH